MEDLYKDDSASIEDETTVYCSYTLYRFSSFPGLACIGDLYVPVSVKCGTIFLLNIHVMPLSYPQV